MHLALFNIGRMIAPEGDRRVAEFYAELDRINSLADDSPGFVWRMVDSDSNNATSVRPYEADPDMLVNLSVWESREAMFNYVYRSAHMDFLRRRREWFVPIKEAITVLWWVPLGHTPSLHEAIGRLDHLREQGPTPQAFTFRSYYEPLPAS
ncbi:DUF3291 domain-containing protein [Nocardia sp. SYP-A9097]|uniref:DUF3291 domain-containing protein n=1 Tax=Nocardia sp. SYP-A9097 TaxID=2663237 RepID=UPI00129A4AD4|nr:DUF3291 domain-containing protein [Nocardia sp. SYP-A9097]MRH87352.1 DUF3291 domain-containing protein [Nocardia sp. SYP-A9097]